MRIYMFVELNEATDYAKDNYAKDNYIKPYTIQCLTTKQIILIRDSFKTIRDILL